MSGLTELLAREPTPAMLKILANLAAGRRGDYGFGGGRSVAGGLSGAYVGLRRRGMLSINNEITDAGRRALISRTPAPGEAQD